MSGENEEESGASSKERKRERLRTIAGHKYHRTRITATHTCILATCGCDSHMGEAKHPKHHAQLTFNSKFLAHDLLTFPFRIPFWEMGKSFQTFSGLEPTTSEKHLPGTLPGKPTSPSGKLPGLQTFAVPENSGKTPRES